MAIARKYVKIGIGAAAGVTTITALFLLLVNLYGFQITGTNDFCAGTRQDPCISLINITNPQLYNVDVYNTKGIKLQFSPEIPEYYLFKKDGTCKGGIGCAAPNGISLLGWRYFDFSKNSTLYLYRFPAKTTKEFLLWGLKNNPKEKIKWSISAKDTELDPVWERNPITLEIKNTNKTYSEIRNITKFNSTCGTYYAGNDSYSGCFQTIGTKKVIYKTEIISEWQEINIDGKIIDMTALNLWCWEDGLIWCKSTLDCDGTYKKPGVRDGCSYCTINKTTDDTSCFDHYNFRLKREIDEQKI